MWVRTQDGTTTINVDRFTVKEIYDPKYGEMTEKIFDNETELLEFEYKNHPEILRKIHHFPSIECPYARIRVQYKPMIRTYSYVIVCGDVVLGTYPTLERAEYVRKNHLERYLLDADKVIVDLSKETDVTDCE